MVFEVAHARSKESLVAMALCLAFRNALECKMIWLVLLSAKQIPEVPATHEAVGRVHVLVPGGQVVDDVS